MAARKGAKTLLLDSVIGYSDIAEKMGVDVKSVRIYAGRDADFPTPVTPASWRSPGFNEADIDRYLELRKVRSSGRSGRPPRSIDSETRLEGGRGIGDRVREVLVGDEVSVRTTSELARLVGLSTAAMGFRIRGQVRWKPSELTAVAIVLGVSESSLLGLPLPRSVDAEPRLERGRAIGDRIREVLATEDCVVKNASELSRAAGISKDALGVRLRGQVAWKLSEVEAIAAALGVPKSRLVGPTSTRSAGESSGK